MPKCEKLRKKHRKVSIGDMVDRATIHLRTIQVPTGTGVDFTEDFTPKRTVWCAINTVSGETIFDSSNTERDVTHEILMRWFAGVTSEDWVELLNGDLLDILPSQNLDERSEFILLKCSKRGPNTNAVNQL